MPQPSKPIDFRAAPHEPSIEFFSAPDGERLPKTPAAPRRISFDLVIQDLSAIDATLQRLAPFSSQELADVLGRIGQVQLQMNEARQALEQAYQAAVRVPAETLGVYELTPRLMEKIVKFAAPSTRNNLRSTSRGFREAVGPVTAARAERSVDVPWLIKDLPQLMKLDLRDCLDIVPDTHSVGHYEASVAALEALGRATQLEELNLPLCRGSTSQLRPVFAALQELTQLTRLTADDPAHRNLSSQLPDEILALITRHHPKLTELPGLRLAAQEGVARLSQLDHLTRLTLELSRPDRLQLETLAKIVSKLETCTLRLDATTLGLGDFHTLIEALPVQRSMVLELRTPTKDVSDALKARGLHAFPTRPIQRFVSNAVLGLPTQSPR